MDIERQRVQDDLRGIVGGDVYCDPIMSQLYASDASIYQIQPLGVIRPRTVADVIATVQYAAEHELPVHPRGAGSGVSGESLGRGLLIDFSQHMRRIRAWRATTVGSRCKAGTALAVLNRRLASTWALVWAGPGDTQRHHDGGRAGDQCIGQPLSSQRLGSRYDRFDADREHRW